MWGQLSSQVTGEQKVSRAIGAEARVVERGRVPSITQAQDPSDSSTRSPCPVFWTWRSVPRAVTAGLCVAPSNGPSADAARAIEIACPRSVPPSAISRYHHCRM